MWEQTLRKNTVVCTEMLNIQRKVHKIRTEKLYKLSILTEAFFLLSLEPSVLRGVILFKKI